MTNPQGFPPHGGQSPHGGPQQYQAPQHPGGQHPGGPQAGAQQQFGQVPGPGGHRPPAKRRRALPFLIIGAVVVLALAAVLIRASLVVGADDYDRADTALASLDLKRDQLTSAMGDATTAATAGKAPSGSADVAGLRADLAAAHDSGAQRDSEVSDALDRIDPALDEYAAAVEEQQNELQPLAAMVAACDAYIDQHPMVEETSTEASVSADIAECEQATKAAEPEQGLAELRQAYVDWIESQKQAAAAYEQYAGSRDLTAYERAVDIEATGNEKVTKVTTGPAVKKLTEPVPRRSDELGAAVADARALINQKR